MLLLLWEYSHIRSMGIKQSHVVGVLPCPIYGQTSHLREDLSFLSPHTWEVFLGRLPIHGKTPQPRVCFLRMGSLPISWARSHIQEVSPHIIRGARSAAPLTVSADQLNINSVSNADMRFTIQPYIYVYCICSLPERLPYRV